jgi:hypothetical protein
MSASAPGPPAPAAAAAAAAPAPTASQASSPPQLPHSQSSKPAVPRKQPQGKPRGQGRARPQRKAGRTGPTPRTAPPQPGEHPLPSEDRFAALELWEDTCGACGELGNVTCCDGCPAVFHLGCVGLAENPNGDWFCPSCTVAGPARRVENECIVEVFDVCRASRHALLPALSPVPLSPSASGLVDPTVELVRALEDVPRAEAASRPSDRAAQPVLDLDLESDTGDMQDPPGSVSQPPHAQQPTPAAAAVAKPKPKPKPKDRTVKQAEAAPVRAKPVEGQPAPSQPSEPHLVHERTRSDMRYAGFATERPAVRVLADTMETFVQIAFMFSFLISQVVCVCVDAVGILESTPRFRLTANMLMSGPRLPRHPSRLLPRASPQSPPAGKSVPGMRFRR